MRRLVLLAAVVAAILALATAYLSRGERMPPKESDTNVVVHGAPR